MHGTSSIAESGGLGEARARACYTARMKVHLGSQNPVKLSATQAALQDYSNLFGQIVVKGISVPDEVGTHPIGWDATVEGALRRARGAAEGADLSIGLESGLIPVPHTKSGYLEISIALVRRETDAGEQIAVGSSSGFEWPSAVAPLIVEGKAEGSEAFRVAGLTTAEKVGATEGGAIGLLTGGRHSREQQIRESLVMALIQLERKEWY